MSILQVARDRLQCLCSKILKSPVTPPEKRGVDRTSEKFAEKKERVKSHIGKFVPLETHYSRAKNCERQYLSSDLIIAKMHEMFNKEYPQTAVQYEYYRRIFCNYFNIGFSIPIVDACSTCASLQSRIEAATTEEENADLKLQHMAHKKSRRVLWKVERRCRGYTHVQLWLPENSCIT